MLHHTMRRERERARCPATTIEAREEKKKHRRRRRRARWRPLAARLRTARLKPRHDESTQRWQVEPQMGNHNSDSLTKHLNSFLPVNVHGSGWRRPSIKIPQKSSSRCHTSHTQTPGGARFKVCPSSLSRHSITSRLGSCDARSFRGAADEKHEKPWQI